MVIVIYKHRQNVSQLILNRSFGEGMKELVPSYFFLLCYSFLIYANAMTSFIVCSLNFKA